MPLTEPGTATSGGRWTSVTGLAMGLGVAGALGWAARAGASTGPLADGIATMVFHLALGGLLVAGLRADGLSWRRFSGRVNRAGVVYALCSGFGSAALTYGCVWLVLIPSSFLAPGYALDWLQSVPRTPPVEQGVAGIMSLLVIVNVCVFAPVVEEWLFRGLLLRRLAQQLGVVASVLLSSALFACLHAEKLGHFAFGVAAALLYLRTGSLAVPVLMHATNNVVALSIEHLAPAPGPVSLAAFREGMWFGIAALAVGLPWLAWVYRTTRSVLSEPFERDDVRKENGRTPPFGRFVGR